jgi:hypothetical protein
MLWLWYLTMKNSRILSSRWSTAASCMTLKHSVRFLSCYLVFVLSDAMTLTFSLRPRKTIGFFHNGDQVYQVVQSWGSLFSRYPACKVFLYSVALTLKNSRVLPLTMMIKSTKLYDPEAYGLISILPTRFF